jgi:hypothetical protein
MLAALAVVAGVFGVRRAEAAWSDPVAYCRAVGTIDAPDASYNGPAVPDWMVRALMRIANAPSGTPQSAFRHAAWRCLDGRVLACSFGANIPCDEKADASRAPSRGATRFCAHHKDSVVVPAYAAGRATVFEWRCAAGDPVIARQVLNVDARGFASAFWHPVAP